MIEVSLELVIRGWIDCLYVSDGILAGQHQRLPVKVFIGSDSCISENGNNIKIYDISLHLFFIINFCSFSFFNKA